MTKYNGIRFRTDRDGLTFDSSLIAVKSLCFLVDPLNDYCVVKERVGIVISIPNGTIETFRYLQCSILIVKVDT